MVTNHMLKEILGYQIEYSCSDSETFKLISPFFDEVELYYFFLNDLELEKRE